MIKYLSGALLAVFLIGALKAGAQNEDEKLWQLRNLGKAFYENPATQYEAVGEFKKALDLAPDSARERVNYGLSLLRAGRTPEGIAELEKAQRQDPSIPHTWFNLGIAYKRESRYDAATRQLERMIALAPDEAISHYNLGVLYKLANQSEKAIQHFQRSAALDPNLAGPHFQLSTAYRQAGRQADYERETQIFQRIKKEQAGTAVPEDLEWSFYSEIYETIDPAVARDTGPTVQPSFSAITLERGLNPSRAGMYALDADGDGQADLLVWSEQGVKLYRNGRNAVTSGLEDVKNVVAVAGSDFDNDGLMDICVITDAGAALYVNQKGTFRRHAVTLPSGRFNQAVWLDYDHDYDMDLFLLGARSALMRNNGKAGFSDQTASFPFVNGQAVDGVVLDVVADTQGMDLAVVYADRPGVIYRDRLAGKYEGRPLESLARGLNRLTAFDFDSDGWTDLAAGGSSGVVLLQNDRKGGFRRLSGPAGAQGAPFFADLENRTVSDLLAGGSVYRNRGMGAFSAGRTLIARTVAATAADFDHDGRLDLAALRPDGALELHLNRTAGSNRWLRVGLNGVKNLKLAPGAEVEVKAGRRYQKMMYQGAPLLFGLGAYTEVDAVRITWPNGLIQNETRQTVGQSAQYKEAQRLSGSCPMIFTWNGQSFEFITDVLGVAPLGASAGDGVYFPVDQDEYIQIAGESLALNAEGKYEIRITEELREVAYLDEIRLIAVDHPSRVDVFTGDKFKAPPFPDFRLFGVNRRIYPARAQDDHRRDVRKELLARDRVYPSTFQRDYAGVAETHALELDFGYGATGERALLTLNGWVDWADGSTFLGVSQQSPEGLIMPYLQVRDAQGNWKTVVEDMGLPAGKPKTITVDLTGKFLSDAREIRIVTNLCLYWDEIFLSDDFTEWDGESPVSDLRMTDLRTASANLRFRGFSQVEVHPERKQPERFIYDEVRPFSMWNPTPGMYTRYGEVSELAQRVDDRYIIMGSGDEIRLVFDAGALPELPEDWRRDFLLFVDGWAKDGDANTAFSQTVEPLPYHGMPQYPYSHPHAYPSDGAHTMYREFYNTRPALRLIRPLTETADMKVYTSTLP